MISIDTFSNVPVDDARWLLQLCEEFARSDLTIADVAQTWVDAWRRQNIQRRYPVDNAVELLRQGYAKARPEAPPAFSMDDALDVLRADLTPLARKKMERAVSGVVTGSLEAIALGPAHYVSRGSVRS